MYNKIDKKDIIIPKECQWCIYYSPFDDVMQHSNMSKPGGRCNLTKNRVKENSTCPQFQE